MLIDINTDSHITNSAEYTAELSEKIEQKLKKFSQHITRVVVYLADENSVKGGEEDKKCTIELRPANAEPLVATAHGATLQDAFNSCLATSERAIRKFKERLTKHQ